MRVRLIRAKDGTGFLDAIALGWVGEAVRVQLRNVRSQAACAWVHAEHISRR